MSRTLFLIVVCMLSLVPAMAQVEYQMVRMEVLPSQAVIKAGDAVNFTVVVATELDTVFSPERVQWSASGGVIDNEGKYIAGAAPGVYEILARHGRLFAKARVEVKVFMPKIVRIDVSPATSMVEFGQSCQLQAIGYDRHNRPVPFVPTWTATGGTISNVGLYSATAVGEFFISAQDPKTGVTGRAAITVLGPKIVRIDVTPASSALEIGGRYQFQAAGYDRRNRPVAFTPVWTTTGGNITQTGLYTATASGQFAITAQDARTGVVGQATVSVRSQTVRVTINPPAGSVYCGQTAQFTATAFDRHGRPVAAAIVWSATGGQVSQTGAFTAGFTPGSYQIMAQDQTSGLQAIATIQVIGQPQPQPEPQPQPGTGRIVVTKWDVTGGNFFKPNAKIDAEVYGPNIVMAKLYTVAGNGALSEIQARSCTDGSKIEFREKYDRFGVTALEIRLFDSAGNLVATVRRSIS